MSLQEYFPVWDKLTQEEKAILERAATKRMAPKGTVLHNGTADCIGLLVIRSGQLRAYILSDEGREITIYRLFERDFCLFSASCMPMPSGKVSSTSAGIISGSKPRLFIISIRRGEDDARIIFFVIKLPPYQLL